MRARYSLAHAHWTKVQLQPALALKYAFFRHLNGIFATRFFAALLFIGVPAIGHARAAMLRPSIITGAVS